ncbi:MAG: UDP-N-acetylmuramoyl-L-alanyl-D-glutamate--2,6-diaminopimelate ligase [Myxococcales bacterium]|nr:UDP-N-acetylmuramoyl-L-alanyl-D-glutamate--2,6-diaminopimelate ligase [Myxococcales bacterium]
MQVRELFADMSVNIVGDDVAIDAISADSRQVREGTLFAAIFGTQNDGHAYIKQACEAGASAILCESLQEGIEQTQIVTENARLTLARAAAKFYGEPATKMQMIGITGTNGKTTCTGLISHILEHAGKKVGRVGTLGCAWGERVEQPGLTTPDALTLSRLLCDMVADDVEYAVLEVSSHALEQHRVSGAEFDFAVFTNLSHDHLDYHQDMDSYFMAKKALFDDRLKEGGTALVNIDDSWGLKLVGDDVMTYSATDKNADFHVVSMEVNAEGTLLTVHTPRGEFELSCPLIGRFNVYNILVGVALGQELGIDNETIAQGLACLPQVAGRMQRINKNDEPLVLVDYAHTPDALEKALKTINEIAKARVYCVFGCGGDRDQSKRPVMGAIVGKYASRAWITNDNPRGEDPQAIANEIEKGLQENSTIEYDIVLDRRQAIKEAISAAERNDIILIAGKGHETIQTVGENKLTFDDALESRAALDAWAIKN